MIDSEKQNAIEVSRIAQDLAHGYYTYLAVMTIARDKRSDSLIPPIQPGQLVPAGFIHSSRTEDYHTFDFKTFFHYARDNEFIKGQLERVWSAGALLTLGDALKMYRYFDRAPVLELVRHLRNGVAHGNRFRIDDPIKLHKYPAHNKDAIGRSTAIYEIGPDLQEQSVLFDFIEAGDLVTLFFSVGFHLQELAKG